MKDLQFYKLLEQARREVNLYTHHKRAEKVKTRTPYPPRIYPCVIQLTQSCFVEDKWADVMGIRIIDAETQEEQGNSDGWPLRLIPSGDVPYTYTNPKRLEEYPQVLQKKKKVVSEWLESKRGCWLAGAYYRDHDRFHRNNPNFPRATEENGHAHAYSHEFDAVIKSLDKI